MLCEGAEITVELPGQTPFHATVEPCSGPEHSTTVVYIVRKTVSGEALRDTATKMLLWSQCRHHVEQKVAYIFATGDRLHDSRATQHYMLALYDYYSKSSNVHGEVFHSH